MAFPLAMVGKPMLKWVWAPLFNRNQGNISAARAESLARKQKGARGVDASRTRGGRRGSICQRPLDGRHRVIAMRFCR